MNLHWHPAFVFRVFPNQGLLCLSQGKNFYLPYSQFPFLENLHPNEAINLEPILDQFDSVAAQQLAFFEHLKAQGILADTKVTGYGAYYPDVSKQIIGVRDFWQGLLDDFQLFSDWLLTDDLARIVEPNRHTLYIQGFGEKILLYRPGNLAECFIQQLIENSPAKRVYEQATGHWPSFHFRDTSSSLAAFKAVLQTEIPSLQEGECVHLDLASQKFFKKTVEHNPDNLTRLLSGPETQASTPDPVLGTRLLSLEDTWKHLCDLVDPMSGLVPSIDVMVQVGELTICEGYYFNTPDIDALDQGFTVRCFGKGLNPTAAKVSALGEAVERSAARMTKQDSMLFGTADQLPSSAFHYDDFAKISDNQFQIFSGQPNHPHSVKRYDGEPLHWAAAQSLTRNSRCYIPATLAFSQSRLPEEQFGRWNSNGCAAGTHLEDALIQGLFELIERDAIAIWWYNKLVRPRVSFTSLTTMQNEIAESLNAEVWLLDITHDLEIPTIVAVATSPEQTWLGFGCHLDGEIAAQRALLELLQVKYTTKRYPLSINLHHSDLNHFLRGESTVSDSALLEKRWQLTKKFNDPTKDRLNSAQELIDWLILHLQSTDLEWLYFDYSRPNLPLKTVRSFVPGLVHMWPEFANERLYHVPVKMGWLIQPNNENTLNSMPLYL